jgi:hypothetical protein
MPYRVADLGQRIGRRIPFSGGSLTCESKPSSASTSKARKLSRNELSSSRMRINDLLHRVVEVLGVDRGRAVVVPPSAEEFCKVLAARVACLKHLNTLDRA